jgi:hypothetical protein
MDMTVVRNSAAVAIGSGNASIGGIQVEGARFAGSVVSSTTASDSLALSLGGFSFFGLIKAHIGGVIIK